MFCVTNFITTSNCYFYKTQFKLNSSHNPINLAIFSLERRYAPYVVISFSSQSNNRFELGRWEQFATSDLFDGTTWNESSLLDRWLTTNCVDCGLVDLNILEETSSLVEHRILFFSPLVWSDVSIGLTSPWFTNRWTLSVEVFPGFFNVFSINAKFLYSILKWITSYYFKFLDNLKIILFN